MEATSGEFTLRHQSMCDRQDAKSAKSKKTKTWSIWRLAVDIKEIRSGALLYDHKSFCKTRFWP